MGKVEQPGPKDLLGDRPPDQGSDGGLRTLGLTEAAKFLQMHPEELRRRAKLPAKSGVPPELRDDISQYVLEQLRVHAGVVSYSWVDPQGLTGWACSWE